MNIEQTNKKLNYLLKYLKLRIDNDLISDPWFISFEEAYKYRNDKRYSIFEPHFSKALHIYDGELHPCPVLGINNQNFYNVVCYKLGNFYKGKFIALSSWIPNPNFDPNKCSLFLKK